MKYTEEEWGRMYADREHEAKRDMENYDRAPSEGRLFMQATGADIPARDFHEFSLSEIASFCNNLPPGWRKDMQDIKAPPKKRPRTKRY